MVGQMPLQPVAEASAAAVEAIVLLRFLGQSSDHRFFFWFFFWFVFGFVFGSSSGRRVLFWYSWGHVRVVWSSSLLLLAIKNNDITAPIIIYSIFGYVFQEYY